MKIINLEQKSGDWHTWRQQGLGSSDAALTLYGRQFNRTLFTLWEEKTGKARRDSFENERMRRGSLLEEEARGLYAAFMGFDPQPLCATHDTKPWRRTSLDGFDPVKKILIEIKCPFPDYKGAKVHQKALDGTVPDYYLPQLWHHVLVAQPALVHYVSYAGKDSKFPDAERFVVVPWVPDPEQLRTLDRAETHFWVDHVIPEVAPGCIACPF